MAKKLDPSTIFLAHCTCGANAEVSLASFGRALSCKTCRGKFVVVWGIDSKTKKATPIALEPSESSGRGFRLPVGMSELGCPCGLNLYARPREAGKRVQCPVCSMWLKLETSKDPQTLETRIRVVKSRLNQLPAVPPAPAVSREATVQEILCECGDSLGVEPEHLGKETQCPGCGTLIKLEVRNDPKTSAMVVIPRVIGKLPPAEKRGIDEELSLDDFK